MACQICLFSVEFPNYRGLPGQQQSQFSNASNDVLHSPVPVVTSHHLEGPIQTKQDFVAEVIFGTDQHSEEVVGTLLDGHPQSIEEEQK